MHEQLITFFPQKKQPLQPESAASHRDTTAIPSEQSSEHHTKPEAREQQEMKGSANRWAWIMDDHIKGNEDTTLIPELIANQKHELPELVSAVMERTCNLQCSHCLYQIEKSSAPISREAQLEDRIIDIVTQMPPKSTEYQPQFLSGGRIMRPSHLELFARLRSLCPDVRLGAIDNGSFVSLRSHWPADFLFDWIDVSIDGVEGNHNQQRQSKKAFAQAIEGLRQAREVTKSHEEGGRVTSLLTLTNINARDIKEVADKLLVAEGDKPPLADWLCITTVGPTNEINRQLETSEDDFRTAWEHIKEASQKFNINGEQRVKLSIYRIEDIEKLAAVVGEKKFLEAFTSNDTGTLPVTARRNFIYFDLDGIRVQYQPLSIWTPEEFLIEADAAYRTAYEGQFTLEELSTGTAKDGRDTKPYTFEQLTPETNFREAFERAVDSYWKNFGQQRIEGEMAAFSRIRDKAKD